MALDDDITVASELVRELSVFTSGQRSKPIYQMLEFGAGTGIRTPTIRLEICYAAVKHHTRISLAPKSVYAEANIQNKEHNDNQKA